MKTAPIRKAAGPVAGSLTYLLFNSLALDPKICATAMVTAWMAVWWITEAVDIGITAFLPFVFFPLTGVMDAGRVAMQYMEQTIFLFIGGFFLAYALEKWNLHTRIAFRILLLTGTSPARVLLGVMVTAFLISMWISNTATVLMLVSAVSAIIAMNPSYSHTEHKNIACALMLALAYSATIGGISTLVGTPPNMVFAGFYEKFYGNSQPVTFVRWFLFAFPFSVTFIVIVYFILKKLFLPGKHHQPLHLDFIREKLKAAGPVSYEQYMVMAVFFITVFLWFTRSDLNLGVFTIPGWATALNFGSYIRDSTVAVGMSFFLFLIPSKQNKGEQLLMWKDVTKLPLRIILLFGSGFALAKGFEESGLAAWLASHLAVLDRYPQVFTLLIMMILITAISEFASNVASIQLMLPILAPLSVSLSVDPLVLMVPATIAASLGYMMPVATAANTIVYGTGHIPINDMMRAGFLLNLTGILLLLLFSFLLSF